MARSNLSFLLSLSPLLLTLVLSLLATAVSTSASSHSPRHLSRAQRDHHAALAAKKRDAGAFDLEPRQVSIRRKRDGSQCKVRGVSLTASVSASSTGASVAATSSVVAPPAVTSSSDAVPATSSPAPVVYVAPTTSTQPAYVAPTTSVEPVYVAPTTSTSIYVAPTTQAAPAPAPPVETPVVNTPVVHNNNGVRKAGLAWPNGNSNNPGAWAQAMGASWYYTWSPWPVVELVNQEFVPMLWGWKQIGDWNANIHSYAGLGVKNALFVNEPNGAGQANMDVGSGCALWTQYFEQLRTIVPGIQLGSAGPDGAPSGKQWLVDFRNQCPQAQPDFYALHWYDVTYQHFQEYVLDFAKTFNKPLWVTEYACQNFNGGNQCSRDYVTGEFFHGTTSWMNGQSAVARYSAFGAMQDLQGVNMDNSLMQGNGYPSALGYAYAASY